MKQKILLTLSHILVATVAVCVTLFLVSGGEEAPSKLEQLENLIQERFIGEWDATAMEDAAAEAMVSSLGDRWSYYIPASEYAAYLEQMENAYVGIGITIQVTEAQDGLHVMEVTRGGPAEEAGILAGDILVEIEGHSALGMDTNAARDLVRGVAGTEVALTFLRGEEPYTVAVERRRIETPVATWQLLEENVGYIVIENFDERCARETIAGIEALLEQGAESLIFDVRNNPGGYASELVEVLDYLLPEGELFRTLDYAGRENVDRSDESFLDIPMAVLVNSESYSAAEFFGAALAEYEAATVVGEKTSGKGYFQNTFALSDGSAVGLSVGKYFTPKGISLAGVGVTPDVEVAVDEQTFTKIYYSQLPPMEDPQVVAAWQLLLEG